MTSSTVVNTVWWATALRLCSTYLSGTVRSLGCFTLCDSNTSAWMHFDAMWKRNWLEKKSSTFILRCKLWSTGARARYSICFFKEGSFKAPLLSLNTGNLMYSYFFSFILTFISSLPHKIHSGEDNRSMEEPDSGLWGDRNIEALLKECWITLQAILFFIMFW